MPTQTINIYISDEDYATFLGMKREIQEEIKQLVKEKINDKKDLRIKKYEVKKGND